MFTPRTPPPPSPATAETHAVLYVDDQLIVVDKPTRLLSVPGRGEDKQDCLIARVKHDYPDALIVHRLDFDTSGIVVLARGKVMHRALSIAFQEREVDKRYVAVVDGKLMAANGEVSLPLLVDWPNRPLHKVDFDNGKPSLTRFRLLAYDAATHSTRVELTPETGRTHQLRVHMQALGHVILGDPLYAEDEARTKAARLLLHAEYLAFTHPQDGRRLEFTCPPPF